uniref:Uncharacterized protein n=1 Tax=Lotharella oceanica TaxID=641309 RepID=A0A7S2U249_9EUKA|mmetsp:Transcript_4433/g.8892  ORF Transcript_4433/g.8892 Transcript_4433/m.8892 type:complete len:165 (+) Transcript_4433:297-791(+)
MNARDMSLLWDNAPSHKPHTPNRISPFQKWIQDKLGFQVISNNTFASILPETYLPYCNAFVKLPPRKTKKETNGKKTSPIAATCPRMPGIRRKKGTARTMVISCPRPEDEATRHTGVHGAPPIGVEHGDYSDLHTNEGDMAQVERICDEKVADDGLKECKEESR